MPTLGGLAPLCLALVASVATAYAFVLSDLWVADVVPRSPREALTPAGGRRALAASAEGA
jgi:hypothetical protein